MILLAVKNLEKYYGANKILEDITFEVKEGERIGLVGKNGCGKTTLFKIISGIEGYNTGMLSIRKDTLIGYLDQIPKYPDDFKTMDVLNEAFKEVFDIKREMKRLERDMTILQGKSLEKVMDRYSYLQQDFELKGGYEIEEKISKVSTGLKFNQNFLDKKFSVMSGGEKTIVILGKILLESPDILLLDEPTNHLDIEAIEWLEEFLCEYKGTVLIISHDRYFLDRVITKTIEIEEGKNNLYLGNYSYYVEEKERRILEQLEAYKQQQKKIKSMEEAIKRFRDWGTRSDDPRFFKKAASMQKRIDKIDKVDRPRLEDKKIKIDFNGGGRSGKEVLEISNLSKSFKDKALIDNSNFSLRYQDKTALIGKNGCGKSTILKMIMNEFINNSYETLESLFIGVDDFTHYEKDKGIIKIGQSVRIGYLNQNVTFENEEYTVLEAFRDMITVSEGKARGLLAKFLFYEDDIFKKVKGLSGGEKSRLRLCQLMHQDTNLLILDEPTNHLDIDSREMLEQALHEFNGTILFISHDRYFINKIVSKVVEMKDGKLITYNGDYQYYVAEKKKEKMRNDESNKKTDSKQKKNIDNKKSDRKRASEKSNLNKKRELEKQISIMEEMLARTNEEIERYASDYSKLEELYIEKQKLQKDIDILLEKWVELE